MSFLAKWFSFTSAVVAALLVDRKIRRRQQLALGSGTPEADVIMVIEVDEPFGGEPVLLGAR